MLKLFSKCFNCKDITLLELLVVIVILGILANIAVPTMLGVIADTEADVCEVNRNEVQNHYERILVLEGVDHQEAKFEQFLLEYDQEICPVGGIVTYVEGEVECSVHGDNGKNHEEDENVDEVPFL
ncbi:hypothetical protein BC6307_21420 [Sutcliffiella cohnii]|uniref:Prepilin-type N-terminal cleavage/methylation domain-containing protein n=1 Tax=Sutcliffiella cohnii TaxID=33932 RepID=A0A223KW02_9BACI|nr:prepilin-type N-terminal cleavage/methylation domain-containing protein [Sutcliffiella cohnii]AST93641.1 hypothetical protein BC6307_21420 [Sutcliffiella cohnii]